MVQKTTEIVKSLYQDDETAWLELMSRVVAEKRFEELDYETLSEYLADMARRDRREVLNWLTVSDDWARDSIDALKPLAGDLHQ